MKLFYRIIELFWGQLSKEELKKFSLLSLGFFLIIGSYWPLKALKESIFINTVGANHLATAKIISVLTLLPLILIYSKIVDHFSKEKLIYIFAGVYGLMGLGFVYLLGHPTIGISNPIPNPNRIIGWAFYVFIETYISLMVSAYWSFIHDVTSAKSAKKGYGMIMFGSQLGGLLFTSFGSFLSKDVSNYSSTVPIIALISFLTFFVVIAVIFILKKTVSENIMTSQPENQNLTNLIKKRDNIGFLEGLKVLIKKPYVAGIFGLTFFHEIITTFMTIQMYITLKSKYLDPGIINKFVFDFNFYIQAIACTIALFGTSFFQRKFGIRICLMSYPIIFTVMLGAYFFVPSFSFIFFILIISKAINYAFNQPAKESLYIPTSKEIKYKTKAWIDIFGARLSKTLGATLQKSASVLMSSPVLIPLFLLVLWTTLSDKMGTLYNKITEDNITI